jgi:hypothetical protein
VDDLSYSVNCTLGVKYPRTRPGGKEARRASLQWGANPVLTTYTEVHRRDVGLEVPTKLPMVNLDHLRPYPETVGSAGSWLQPSVPDEGHLEPARAGGKGTAPPLSGGLCRKQNIPRVSVVLEVLADPDEISECLSSARAP